MVNSEGEAKQHITVAYEGTLSTRLQWNQEELDRSAELVDLKTHVLIRNGHERPGSDVSPIDDLLIWRGKINKPGNEVQAPQRKTVVVFDYKSASASITLNDQIISSEIRSEDDNRFSEPKFVRAVNDHVRRGLREISRREKLETAKQAARLGVVPLAAAVIFTKTGMESIELMAYGGEIDSVPHAFTGVLGFWGSVAGAIGVPAYVVIDKLPRVFLERPLHFQSGADVNPGRHLANAVKAGVHFTKRQEYVSLKT